MAHAIRLRPGQRMMREAQERGRVVLKGIDVSNNNGAVDWAAVARSGVTFAFLKATEGTSFVDVYYPINRTAAHAQGIKVGAYHFARPGRSGPEQQAEYFLAAARPAPAELVPVLDLEDDGGLRTAQVQRWTAGFLGAIERELGVKAIIYSGPWFWRSHVGNADFSEHPLWLAQYTRSRTADVPGAWKAYTIWQHSADGSVAGVRGRCDLNRCDDRALDALTLGDSRVTMWPELHPGARSPEVQELKRALTVYFNAHPKKAKPRFTQDDVYGAQAVAAVKAFQKAHRLAADGVVGDLTWQALENEYAELRLGRHPH
jgi:GH25 family lysozyme M1 (1,4-beta-N-acetylmuramidase)